MPMIGDDIDTDRIIPARFYAALHLMDLANRLSEMKDLMKTATLQTTL